MASRRKNEEPRISDFPAIYASPTVETLDGSFVSGRQRDEQPPNSYKATPPKNVRPPDGHHHSGLKYTPQKTPTRAATALPPSRSGTNNVAVRSSKREQKRRRKHHADFQHDENALHVSVTTVDVASRTVFEPLAPVSTREWLETAESAELQKKVSMRKRLSPSLQHLELLHRFQSIKSIRQLNFSPSVGLNADALWTEQQQQQVRGSNKKKRDGRYRSIDPLQATRDVLPETPPLLSNRKHRLPMRSDVGFPNTTPEEIKLKQEEIRLETQWEEASPRLIVLITSDNLGQAVMDDGIPLAGKELLMAKKRNRKLFKTSYDEREGEIEVEPNRHSVLAPPLGATHSSSLGWRPRPFYDRPPDMLYGLASPLRVNLDVGDVEPLVCTLTLYSVGRPSEGQIYGKMSEDFYLPAGDWHGKVNFDAARGEDGALDEGLVDAWHRRKHKALFSYDPLLLSGDDSSLHLVLQVYRVSSRAEQSTAAEASETPSTPNSKKKGIGRRIKKRFSKLKHGSERHEDSTAGDSEMIQVSSEDVFEKFGTQLLTPLCFGVTPFCPNHMYSGEGVTTPGMENEKMKWPSGSKQMMHLYACPSLPEDDNSFLERVTAIAEEERNKTSKTPIKEASYPSVETGGSDDTFDDGQSTRKGLLSKMISRSHVLKIGEKAAPLRVVGRASLFTSFLGTDFTQCMLTDPAAFGAEIQGQGPALPRLLVDVSGDCAIAVNPAESTSILPSDGRKRSDLIRLPPTPIASGYAGASEVREMMFLPPRFEKQYDVDPPASRRSMQNLLFIYPRFLKIPQQEGGRSRHKPYYAVRVRLWRHSPTEDGQMEVLRSFYNPAPWAGPPISEAAFTKVLASNGKTASGKDGVIFRDEIKMRLPMIVDGSYNLHFSLVEVEVEDGDVDVQIIADTTVPLSSSSTREASSGVRVTTIIPNGNHRLKLGEHVFQFETRLISNIHVADPTTATALRDFPFVLNADDLDTSDEKFRTLALVPSRSVVGKSVSAQPIVDLKIPFYQLFATASDSTLLGNFHLFAFMHLCNMVNHKKNGLYVSSFLTRDETVDEDSRFLMDNLQSLFELIRKVKLTIVTRATSDKAAHRIEAFVKDMVDTFDENLFTSADSFGNAPLDTKRGPTRINLERSRSDQSTIDKTASSQSAQLELDEELDGAANDGGAVHLRAKDSVRAEIDLRLSRTLSKIKLTGNPLARVAYGATQTDRWRAEAEHYQEGARFSHLVDDDETVLTALYPSKTEENAVIKAGATWSKINDADDDASVVEKPKGKANETLSSKGPVSFADTPIVKRVRSAAQVIIAPCIAPSFSNPKGASSPAQANYDVSKIQLGDELKKQKKKLALSMENNRSERSIVLNGSDDEDDFDDNPIKGSSSRGETAAFRGEEGSVIVPFSYGQFEPNTSESRVFAYEPIMALWVKAWIHHTAVDSKTDGTAFPILTLWSGDNSSPIYGFYAHMDVLLPLCLKSMVLRCSPVLPKTPTRSTVILDAGHMEILFPLVGVFASSLLGEANSHQAEAESLLMALDSADTVLDFLIGISAVVHPQQMAELLQKFFKVLRDCEISRASESADDFQWTAESIHSVRCSRQIRLRAIERLSAFGPFLAMNFPIKYAEWKPERRQNPRSWMQQAQGAASKKAAPSSPAKAKRVDLLPKSGWLSELLVNESLLICSLSCEVFVAEAIAHIETAQQRSGSPLSAGGLQHRPGKSLTREDLLLFQGIGLHAITCVHELLIRRHAMDVRFQTEQCRSRIAALVVVTVLEKSTASVRWLARMESTHKIRSLWLVCFSYVLQEAPEALLRSTFREYCDPDKDFAIHRIIRLLRLSSSTFQCLVDETTSGESSLDSSLLPWLSQESFNSICASIIVIIDECTSAMKAYPKELKKMAQGTVDLLLHILTVPQSAVTHLRTVGGALQALEKFGGKLFLEVTGDNLQHWIRVMLTLMNSISLSVRSIAVDFVISLLGEAFARMGTIEDIAIVFATVLPEVVAREIALFSVAGLVKDLGQVEQVLWPLRRAWADIEDANPLDDDRVDPQLPPLLSSFCRSCQAVIDGVIVELRLRRPQLFIVGTDIEVDDVISQAFDADEESLFEAANYFTAEASPMQRLRWLNTLKLLHESKGQWVEAAETLMLSARTISDSLPHLRHVWTPSEFVLWNDAKRSLWLGTIGQDQGSPGRGNLQVMEFASGFLHPEVLLGEASKKAANGKIAQPSVQAMCNKLVTASKESIALYLEEEGNEDLAFSRLESLLRVVMVVIEEHSSLSTKHSYQLPLVTRKRLAAEAAALRKASASLNSEMTRLAEKLLLVTESETQRLLSPSRAAMKNTNESLLRAQYYVRVKLSGIKPKRFLESTSIPTYFEWENPCICRVPQSVVKMAMAQKPTDSSASSLKDRICNEFGRPLRNALAYGSESFIVFRVGVEEEQQEEDSSVTYLDVSMVHVDIVSVDAPLGSIKASDSSPKRFLYRKSSNLPGAPPDLPFANGYTSRLVELTVARPFPCALSRQRTLITSEFVEGSA